jgi:LPS-assembly protein
MLLLFHLQLWPQALTMQFPPAIAAAEGGSDPASQSGAGKSGSPDSLPDAPDQIAIPIAEPLPPRDTGVPVEIHALEQREQGDIFTLTGDVVIHYRSYTLRADKVTYNRSTSEAEAAGHLQLEGGVDDEVITASHGTVNLNQQTARFFDALGTVGVRQSLASHRVVYTTQNPFVFTGRIVIKTGPDAYRIVDGTMTSCRLPNPDWRFFASRITVENGQARTANATFRLLHVPVFYLPYATLPVEGDGRQSGILIPVFSTSSTKGTILGESLYWAINRSADLLAGAEYFSKRGWSPNAEFRLKGRGQDFANIRFKALLDRGLAPNNINQGGEDLLFAGRHDLDEYTRTVSNVEYLSSYVYRLAFNESFQSAVNSEVKSDAFLVHSRNGLSEDVRFDRYQSFQSQTAGDEIRILHLPSLDFEAVDSPIAHTNRPSQFYWGLVGSATGLSRAEPLFSTSREVARLDVYPHLSLPVHLGGWSFRPEAAVRETFYSKSQLPGVNVPSESSSTLNRASFEAGFEMRPPVIERVFDSNWLVNTTHHEFKHTVEPEMQYRYVTGIDTFNQVLRFDTADIVSNTNQVTYSLTQHLFLKNLETHPCRAGESPLSLPNAAAVAGISPGAAPAGQATAQDHGTSEEPEPDKQQVCGGGTRDWISWQVAQRYYFDPSFGGAITPGRRNVLESTLDLTGVAFILHEHRTSPILSRLRVRTTGNTDLEWDLDYNTRAGRMESSNLFANYHEGNFFTGIGHSRMVALEPSTTSSGQNLPITTYDQVRLLAGFGNATRKGLSVAANAGYDFTANSLQYDGVQASYNWACCGVSVEYRRLILGTITNDGTYRFNFTLANIGAAGNLRRTSGLF